MANPTRSATLAQARKGLGVSERPSGSNRTPFNVWFYGRMVAAAWCAIWMCWVLILSGWKIKKIAGAFALGDYLLTLPGARRVNPNQIRGGDVVVYKHPHIGICEARLNSHELLVDEGNHFDKSARATREEYEIDYGIRLPYANEHPAPKPAAGHGRYAKLREDVLCYTDKARTHKAKESDGRTDLWAQRGGEVAVEEFEDGEARIHWPGSRGAAVFIPGSKLGPAYLR